MNTFLVMATIAHCYVGCNTGSDDRQGLHVLECNTETGEAKIVQSVKDLQGTTYFQLDSAGKYLYSAAADAGGQKNSSRAVRFPINGNRLGKMETLASLPSTTPCHVALSADGRQLAYAAYLDAVVSTVSPANGTRKSIVLSDEGVGPNAARQKKAYAHFAFYTPGGTRLGIVNLGCDRISFFDPETLVEDTSMRILFDAGDGPRHAVWSNNGLFLYVLNELSSSVTAFAYAPARAGCTACESSFRKIGKWSMLPADFNRWNPDKLTLATKAAAIKLTADGKILMASNRGYDSIAFYDVNGDGTLTLRNIAKLTGAFPRDFELMPGEKFMVVGHKMSNEIQIYRFDRASYTLTPVGAPIPAWRPLCFKFAK